MFTAEEVKKIFDTLEYYAADASFLRSAWYSELKAKFMKGVEYD